eukprot:COSAG02_NODE_11506_length_1710_cov_4.997236_2_plen_216_part_00
MQVSAPASIGRDDAFTSASHMEILDAFYKDHEDPPPDPQRIAAEINWYRARYPVNNTAGSRNDGVTMSRTHAWEEQMYRAIAAAHGGIDPREYFATLSRPRTPPRAGVQRHDSNDAERTESEDEEDDEILRKWVDAGNYQQQDQQWKNHQTQSPLHRSVLKSSDSQLSDHARPRRADIVQLEEAEAEQELYRTAWSIGQDVVSSVGSSSGSKLEP